MRDETNANITDVVRSRRWRTCDCDVWFIKSHMFLSVDV